MYSYYCCCCYCDRMAMTDLTADPQRYLLLLIVLRLTPLVFCSCISISEQNIYLKSDYGKP